MACEKCGRGFTQFDELQVHILTDHADEYSSFALFGGSGFQNKNTNANASATPEVPVKQEEPKEEKEEEKEKK